jgi:hypothetical protein
VTPIPSPDLLPAPGPLWLFKVLLWATFLLHLLFMNATWGGSLLLSVFLFKGREKHLEVARGLAALLPYATALAIVFGVAPLLLIQVLHGRLFYTASILLGTPFLLVIPVLLAAYALLYLLRGRLAGAWRPAPYVALLVTALFGYVGFVQANLFALLTDPERFRQKYLDHPAGLQFNLADFTVLPRFLHVLLASVALAGLYVAIRGAKRLPADPETGRWQFRSGITWFAGATLVNFAVGIWWLLALSPESMRSLMGGSLLGTVAFAVGLAGGLAALVLSLLGINSVKAGPFLHAAGGCLILTILSMVLMRDATREAALAAQGVIPPVVLPQWGAIALFLLLFAGGVALCLWMLARLARASAGRPSEAAPRPGLSDSGLHKVDPAESGVRKLIPSDSQPLKIPGPPSSGVRRLDDEE